MDQRRVADIAVTNDPANVRGGPEHLARLDTVDVLHRPVQRDKVARRGAHHAFGLAGGAGGVKDIGRVVALDRHAFGGLDAVLEGMPGEIAPLDQLRNLLFTLENDGEVGLVRRHLDRAVQQRFVMHNAARLDPARGGDDRLGLCVVDAHGKLGRGEPAEYHRVDRTKAGAGQHRLQRLGHHRHVDDDAVALFDALGAQGAGKACHALLQLGIGDATGGMGDGAVVDDGKLIATPGQNVAVHRVPAGVDHAVLEPFVKRCVVGKQCAGGFFDPVNRLGLRHPEPFGVSFPACVDV
ncbi:hypothetical protein GALL_482510 [mine drainage metagenome]|uniref:Uncharacterized protein n=1 Tax=mine drainage metagenome TaxID=410659 RepID=A0A1J5PRD8_9ZZZZ